MTPTETKALALKLRNRADSRNWDSNTFYSSDAGMMRQAAAELTRLIETHEAFERRVSDAVERAIDDCGHDGMRKGYIFERFSRLILPKPIDPLADFIDGITWDDTHDLARQIREAISNLDLGVSTDGQ